MQDKSPNSRFGADINAFTQNVNFQVLARTVDFLYLRASSSSTGRFREDAKFVEFARQARNYGIPVGAYHYALPSADLNTADQQVDLFIATLQKGFGTNNYGDLFPVVDIEAPRDKSISTATLVAWVDRFRKTFERKTRRKLMIYTGVFFVELYDNFEVNGQYPLSDMPLWIAMYVEIPTNPPYPPDVGGWTGWRIWQYTEQGQIVGVSPPTDLNWGPESVDLLTQPETVRGLQASKDNTNIYVRWRRNPDIDLAGYNVFVNGNWMDTVEKDATSTTIPLSKVINVVPKGTAYVVSIEAFDTDGEVSPQRASVNIGRDDTSQAIKKMIKSTTVGEKVIVPVYRKMKRIQRRYFK